jgi:hypothetical protein
MRGSLHSIERRIRRKRRSLRRWLVCARRKSVRSNVCVTCRRRLLTGRQSWMPSRLAKLLSRLNVRLVKLSARKKLYESRRRRSWKSRERGNSRTKKTESGLKQSLRELPSSRSSQSKKLKRKPRKLSSKPSWKCSSPTNTWFAIRCSLTMRDVRRNAVTTSKKANALVRRSLSTAPESTTSKRRRSIC